MILGVFLGVPFLLDRSGEGRTQLIAHFFYEGGFLGRCHKNQQMMLPAIPRPCAKKKSSPVIIFYRGLIAHSRPDGPNH